MGKYLEIAQKALSKTPLSIAEDRCTTKDQPLKGDSDTPTPFTHCEISELSEISPVTDQEIKKSLEDDWEEVSNDPDQLEAARYLVATAKKIEAGIVPDGYTKVTNCKYCGPVFVYESFPQSETQSCPWCRNRYKGLPIPKGKTT